MSHSYDFDLIVIGAGSGGLSAVEFGLALGLKIALVEKSRIGGDCTWTGCVPSKSFLHIARLARTLRDAQTNGFVTVHEARFNLATAQAYLTRKIQEIYEHESPEALRERGVTVLLGTPSFTDPHTIQLNGAKHSAKVFVLATGAHPITPALPGLEEIPYLTYETIWDNVKLPKKLVIIGSGPVACEVGQGYRAFGAEVAIIGERLLPQDEPEASNVLETMFAGEGIERIREKAESVRYHKGEYLVMAHDQAIRGDQVLVATGRRANISGLNLEAAGVAYTDSGITVDKTLKTSTDHIFAVGDCIGGAQFTHYAGFQGFQAVRNAFLPLKATGVVVSPWATFTTPEVAKAGLTEAQARKRFGDQVQTRMWHLTRNDRAVIESATEGFVKLVYRQERILGATIVGLNAADAIQEWSVAITNRIKITDVAGSLHIYPTIGVAAHQLAAEIALENFQEGVWGRVAQRWLRV
jgi:pyruvate/2-oxoglutarate dehydrogenase complex dihydrolipoamide dehydrogenase (E3) component